MNKIIFMIMILIFSGSLLFSQSMTERLSNEIQKKQSGELVDVTIYLKEDLPKESINLKSLENKSKLEKRQIITLEFEKFTERSQKALINFLIEYEALNIKQHWLINMVSCTVNKFTIDKLLSRDDILLIDYNESQIAIDPITRERNIEYKILSENPDTVWSIKQTGVNKVWKQGYEGQNVLVSVIDTGVDYNHSDIKDNMWESEDYPHHGWDFRDNDDDPLDQNVHGTHCAGTIAGNGKSGIMTGIAKAATIMAVKIGNAAASMNQDDAISAIEFSIKNGADILSLSLGFDSKNVIDKTKFREAMTKVNTLGVVAFVAVGNEAEYLATGYALPNNVLIPGSCPPPWVNPEQPVPGGISAVIAVGASTQDDEKCDFSSIGPSTWEDAPKYKDYVYAKGEQPGLIRPDIVFPGKDIISLKKGTADQYISYEGTSMATPGAAAVAALMLSKNGNLTPEDICRILETTAVKVQNMTVKNNIYGSGRIDALAALNAVESDGPKRLEILITNNNNVTISWEEPENKSGLLGYNIYKNRKKINSNLIQDLTYNDKAVKPGKYIYYSTAVYSTHETPSNIHDTFITTSCNPPDNISLKQSTENIIISWNFNEEPAKEIFGYNVYLNGKQINSEIIKGNSFIDKKAKNDKEVYFYNVDVLYSDDCYSSKSNSESIKYIKYTNYCIPPVSLIADRGFESEYIDLTWKTPALILGANESQPEGNYGKDKTEFFICSRWSITDLKDYYGLDITEVCIFPNEEAKFTLMIWEPGNLKYEQSIDNLKYNQMNFIKLDNPYVIDFTKDLRVGFKIENKSKLSPIGYENISTSKIISYISSDGTKWTSLKDENIKGIWKIGIKLSDLIGLQPQGYNVYKDGNQINQSIVTDKSYKDSIASHKTQVTQYYVTAVYDEICESISSNIVDYLSDGINIIQDKNSIIIYPNPANNNISIEGNFKKYILYNSVGKIILSGEFKENDTNIIDINALPSGLYFIELKDMNNNPKTSKFVKR